MLTNQNRSGDGPIFKCLPRPCKSLITISKLGINAGPRSVLTEAFAQHVHRFPKGNIKMANPRSRGAQWGTILLGSQLAHVGLENVPPVTLALIIGQTLVFLEAFPEVFPSPMDVCMSSYLVYHRKGWLRMIKGALYHGDDMHLYFNMLSLLYKGSILERAYGSLYYTYMMGTFTCLTSATYVGLGLLLSHLTGDESYMKTCAVGFSGVLFAMKVLGTLASPPGTQYIGQFPVPSKYIFWAELILIQLAAPNASFVGHLAGILVGLAYAKGPLKYLMNFFLPLRINSHSNRGRITTHSSRRWFSSSGSSGYRSDRPRRGLISRLTGPSLVNDYNDSREPPYSSVDYRRNPTFETDSIFNQDPPNIHENIPRMHRRSPQSQQPGYSRHRSDEHLGSGFSRYRSYRESPSASEASDEDRSSASQSNRDFIYTGLLELSNVGAALLHRYLFPTFNHHF
ncbi:Rhomboid- protein 4 [Bulinus truncatus]|nr:Rhomboid- protein 4 [Bulinus truncatus]